MKLCRNRYGKHGCEINMASLIDVVLLLIIFFMTVSQLTQAQRTELLELPVALQGDIDDSADRWKLIVNLRADSKIFVTDKQVTLDELERMITAGKKDHRADAVEIVLRADRHVDGKYVRQILSLCRKHEIRRFKTTVLESDAK